MSVFFLGSWGMNQELGKNKSGEPQSGSWAICLFCAPIHSTRAQKKDPYGFAPQFRTKVARVRI